jgi:hypothetical protein
MANAAYEIIWTGTLAGQFVQTVQHVVGDEPTPTNAFETAKAIIAPANFDAVNDAFMGVLPSPYYLTSVRSRRVYPDTGPTAINLAGVYNIAGGQRAGDISAAQVNPVILWIPATDPAKLGKLFIPGVSEDDIDNMALDASLITDIVTFIDAWIAGISVSAITYFGAKAIRATVSPYEVVNAIRIEYGQVSPLIGTQRRRLRPV